MTSTRFDMALLIRPLAMVAPETCGAVTLSGDADSQALIGERITYEFDCRMILNPGYPTKKFQDWLPAPPTDSVQVFKFLEIETFSILVTPTENAEPKIDCIKTIADQACQNAKTN